MYIGITGQIGSGKTTAAKILASFGAAVIDADRIGREVVERSASLRNKLARRFGSEILTPSGKLSRKKLARLAFADKTAKQHLDRLVHPFLLKELRQRMKREFHQRTVIVIDAALLLDWELDRRMDVVIVIHASRETRLKRLVERGIARDDALARERSQLPYSEYRKRADYIILNSGTEEDLRPKLSRIYRKCIRQKN